MKASTSFLPDSGTTPSSGLHAGLFEQRLCRGDIADELAMREGVGDEVARRRLL